MLAGGFEEGVVRKSHVVILGVATKELMRAFLVFLFLDWDVGRGSGWAGAGDEQTWCLSGASAGSLVLSCTGNDNNVPWSALGELTGCSCILGRL